MYNDQELKHFGVKGMKWGVKKQRDTPRSYQRRLNRLDKKTVKQIGKLMESEHYGLKYSGKVVAEKHKVKPNEQKINKYTDNVKKFAVKYNEANKNVKNLESETWKVIGKAIEKGYKIDDKEVIRNANNGKTYLAAFFAGPAASAGYMSSQVHEYGDEYTTILQNGRVFRQNPTMVVGRKYKVRKN